MKILNRCISILETKFPSLVEPPFDPEKEARLARAVSRQVKEQERKEIIRSSRIKRSIFIETLSSPTPFKGISFTVLNSKGEVIKTGFIGEM